MAKAKHTPKKLLKAISVGTAYLGADLAQRESDESPCDVQALGRAIDLLEAVPELLTACEKLLHLWEAQAIVGGSPDARTWGKIHRECEIARSVIAKAKGA